MTDERVPVPPSEQRCGNCLSFKSGSGEAGWCRFNPPVMIAPHPGATWDTPRAYWSDVHSDDWCFQWQKIP